MNVDPNYSQNNIDYPSVKFDCLLCLKIQNTRAFGRVIRRWDSLLNSSSQLAKTIVQINHRFANSHFTADQYSADSR